jgi:hypothetical protein
MEQALVKARSLWGPTGTVRKINLSTGIRRMLWPITIYRVGCIFQGRLVKAGEGATLDEAFASVNYHVNGKYNKLPVNDPNGPVVYLCVSSDGRQTVIDP